MFILIQSDASSYQQEKHAWHDTRLTPPTFRRRTAQRARDSTFGLVFKVRMRWDAQASAWPLSSAKSCSAWERWSFCVDMSICNNESNASPLPASKIFKLDIFNFLNLFANAQTIDWSADAIRADSWSFCVWYIFSPRLAIYSASGGTRTVCWQQWKPTYHAVGGDMTSNFDA